MKLVAFVFNIILVGFTCLVIMTDGFSRETVYIVLTMMLLLVPIFSAVVIYRLSENNGWLGFHKKGKVDNLSSISPMTKIVAIISNIVLFGFSCWAFVSQYPHPKEGGYFAYVLFLFLTPILSSLVILPIRANISQQT